MRQVPTRSRTAQRLRGAAQPHARALPPRGVAEPAAARGEASALGRKLTLDEFRAAWREAEKARVAAREWAGGFDAILTLPAPGQAPRGLADTGSAVFNALWTQLYMPCLTLPAGQGPDGLPVGIQLVGRRHDDARLLEIGPLGRAPAWEKRR